ncbi:MAG: signal peptide peptidase SppA [Hyphomicrobiaceae bacterium]|nr:MAG: signal peptide peptidase SppA [Hyphomicrobiaceae bacterium]
MTLQSDAIVDRRRLRRRLTLWRVLAVVAGVIAVTALAIRAGGDVLGGRQIARINITGVITEDRAQLALLKTLAKDDRVKAVIVHLNSPGGTTTGGEALYEGLRELAKKKPVVAVFGTIATSAAYIVGLGTDHIVARGNSVTGSVGVIFQWAEVSQLLDKLGIRMNEVKSGTLKATPSPFQPLDEAGRRLAEEMVADSQRWFLRLVSDRRKIDPAAVPGLTQGRIFTGRQALDAKLVDALGSEIEAVKWLEEQRGLTKDLAIVDWKPKQESPFGFLGTLSIGLRDLFWPGADRIAGELGLGPVVARLRLDGLVSVWHAPAN